MMKDSICVAVGLVGGFFTAIFGGWDSALVTLVVFMAIDFFTGIITAMMKKSKHTESGGLSSKAGWFGLAKKVCTLMLIVVASGLKIAILLILLVGRFFCSADFRLQNINCFFDCRRIRDPH